jgi:N,N'-diacetyllegionaminate synthase
MPETHIIAELAWGHDGTRSQAIDIMRHAKKAGADSFSIHITDLPSYIVPHYGGGKGKVSEGREALDIYKYLEKINLDHGDWKEIKAEADRIGMQLCIMPNDMASFRFAEEWMDPDYYVLSPASFIEHDLMLQIAGTGRDTLFRTGGATLAEIENAVNIFRKAGSRIILLHGYQNYPTSIGDTNLALLKTLKDLFGTEVGLADHIDGGSPLARIIPLLSLCYGATYIEKHITLDRSKKSEDF